MYCAEKEGQIFCQIDLKGEQLRRVIVSDGIIRTCSGKFEGLHLTDSYRRAMFLVRIAVFIEENMAKLTIYLDQQLFRRPITLEEVFSKPQ